MLRGIPSWSATTEDHVAAAKAMVEEDTRVSSGSVLTILRADELRYAWIGAVRYSTASMFMNPTVTGRLSVVTRDGHTFEPETKQKSE